MTGFVLRRAGETDAGAVGAILSGFIDETDWMPRIHTRAEDLSFAGTMIERGWVRVAERQGEVVGFAARDDDVVHALYVSSNARRLGCGTAMLHDMQSRADRLDLWTFQANTGAHVFYKSNGFREIARTNGARNDEKLPDIRFVWERRCA